MKRKCLKMLSAAFVAGVLLSSVYGCNPGNGGNGGNGSGNGDGEDNTQSSEYSKILEDVLKDEYYNGLIAGAKENTSLYRSASLDPHPYAFLKKKGHDIDAVKSGELECRTVSYVLDEEPNNLYIMTYVENASSDPYYTEYTLKYTLSEQEMKDYKFLHKDGSNYYIQAVFMNDAISSHKKETILSETKMNVAAHKEMRENVTDNSIISNIYNNKSIDFIMAHFDENNQTFDIRSFPKYSSNTSMVLNDKMLELYFEGDTQNLKIVDGIYYAPTSGGRYRFQPNSTKEHIVTYYYSQDTILGNIYTQNLNDSLNND